MIGLKARAALLQKKANAGPPIPVVRLSSTVVVWHIKLILDSIQEYITPPSLFPGQYRQPWPVGQPQPAEYVIRASSL